MKIKQDYISLARSFQSLEYTEITEKYFMFGLIF
jgi:hypothetical protein